MKRSCRSIGITMGRETTGTKKLGTVRIWLVVHVRIVRWVRALHRTQSEANLHMRIHCCKHR